jgi:hypothetical protein
MYGAGATVGAATAGVALPVVIAFTAGLQIGDSFNRFYERARGQSLGDDLYDLFHPR